MDPLPLLKDLVSANSVNPSLVPGAAGEAAAAEVARAAMAAAGLDVVVTPVRPGRPNVIGVLEARSTGPAVMLCGHLDTVGVHGMVDPFLPRIENGRLYGRGAQDMKGGIAAMIAAAAELARSWRRGRLIIAAVVDEEHESLGATDLAREWRADAAIVTEPTDLALAIGHKGFAWLEITTRGRAAHGSRPKEGRDAIARMGRVLASLESLDRDLQSRPPNEIQGTGSLHASLINGGRELSSYPDMCTLQMERRTVSGEDEHSVLREVDRILSDLKHRDPEFDGSVRLMAYRSAYQIDRQHQLVHTMSEAIRQSGRSATPVGMSFWTDAAILAESGTPSVLFGPGGAGLHSTEEYVRIEDVYACKEILVEAIKNLVSAP